ncbi:SDR family oxidoreductase [Natrialba asiatica]|uniref:Short-chain dehydrogenase/reductase SDR n=1 Tax=Natrialba asiatica (strain ATCC 700177 / DSM 12278 / JCM 9576 / FERM P-10747 / NBRC 102637 / 172P1) TaxID=29540 RepID=M0ALW5_NATA1|nr:SDR family oxidoreductase [Natrialba asiatica]ELY99341.1 short-chain dehydrogenase/reductase SDR [Natrialba asiatica DSM 12278]
MTVALKPLDEQVIVITGASSGIGLTTARMAADRGARLVLVARSEAALAELTEEIRREGGDAEYVVADVSEPDDIREISRVARETYGGFDTWVNGAAVPIYGKLREIPIEDLHEQFDVNVWGLLYGSFEATEQFRERAQEQDRDYGGALINIGSIASERAILLQGSYSASKHAVKGFTDALRMELEEEDAPVSVTLVKPSSIDTPYPDHAKNYMDDDPTLPPPVYAPETVARAILHAAAHPQREVTVGGGGKSLTVLDRYAPGLLDRIMEAVFVDRQQTDRPSGPEPERDLDTPSGTLDERGDYEGHVAETSSYTRLLQRRSLPTTLGAGAAAIGAYVLYRVLRGTDPGDR